jgi:hypothetical protein
MKQTINNVSFLLLFGTIVSCGQNQTEEEKPTTMVEQTINTPKVVVNPKKLDPNAFEIIKTENKPLVDNYYLLLKMENIDEASLNEFVISFSAERCTKDCNINLFDTKSIKKYIGKYPLDKSEYIEYADHFVASSSFDSPMIWMYPYQDIKYKNLGGKNWKKEPIK